MASHTRPRVLCAMQMDRHSSKTRHPSFAFGLNIFRPCLILIELSKIRHYSTSFSCQSRSKWTSRPQCKNLPKQVKGSKAAGVDRIPSELWKNVGPALHSKLHKPLVSCWEQSKLSEDLRNAVIITLYKKKEKKSDCSNYQGINLLSIECKSFARVLLNRLVPIIAEDHFMETQWLQSHPGYHRHGFCSLAASKKGSRTKNCMFIDLTKTFHTVSKKGLWLIMERFSCPPNFLNLFIQLHEDQHGQVRLNSDLSKPFPIANGVKQGCCLALTLFSILFSMMLKQAIRDLDDEDAVYIRYRFDGSPFNLKRLQAHTKTWELLI